MIAARRGFNFGPMVEPRHGEQMLLVETYGPSADATPVLQAGAGLGTVTVHCTIAVPGDEVVFYLVTGPSVGEVRQVLATLGLESVRIVPARWVARAP